MLPDRVQQGATPALEEKLRLPGMSDLVTSTQKRSNIIEYQRYPEFTSIHEVKSGPYAG